MHSFIKTLLLFFVFFLVSCGSDDEQEPKLARIDISSSNGSKLDVQTNETTNLTVKAYDQNNRSLDVDGDVSWSASTSNVSLDVNGTVTAMAVGTSVITASLDGVETSYDIEVWDSSAPRIEIYVSDVGVNRNGPHQIIRYDEDGSDPVVIINSNLSRPQDIVFLEDQDLVLISNLGTNNITKYDIETGQYKGTFSTGISGPTRIDIGPDNLLYAIQWNGGPVKRYNLDGTFVDDFTEISIDSSIGIDWDSNGNMYVASYNNTGPGSVWKFDTEGTSLGVFINSNLAGPTDIWFDDLDNLFVSDWSGNSVKKFDSEGTYLGVFINGVNQPEGVDFLDDGSILIGASGTSSIKRYHANGNFIGDLVAPKGGGLVTPNALVLRRVNYQ